MSPICFLDRETMVEPAIQDCEEINAVHQRGGGVLITISAQTDENINSANQK